MTAPRLRPTRVLAAGAVALAALLAGCSSGSGSGTPTWKDYNASRKQYDASANAVAKQVADRMQAKGIACTNYGSTSFDLLVKSYVAGKLPLPLGSGGCDSTNEGILIEVFRKDSPNATDFMAAKRRLICERALKLGKQPDGSQSFDGVPYVQGTTGNRTWVIEPDTFDLNKKIATALGLKSRNACAGMKV